MKVVTSFGPSRIARQQKCLASWKSIGCDVVGVQSSGESQILQSHFPDATLIETDLVGDLFGRPNLVRTTAAIAQAVDEPVLLLNSDIEIQMTQTIFNAFWGSVGEKELKCGVRWDIHPRTRMKRLFKWGIDSFLITPAMVDLLPDIGMTLGAPAWDYWIPWHLSKTHGYRVTTSKGIGLMHEVHDKGWSRSEYDIGLKLFADHYGVSGRDLTAWVQQVTGRQRTPNWRPRL